MGISKYSVSNAVAETGFSERLLTIFKESVISYDNAQNIVVIKTMPGLASAACYAIDSMNVEDIVGTLAGDDTGFLLMHDTETASEFCKKLGEMLL